MAELLRCYVEHRGDDWEAVCLDYDIAVQGHSLSEIQEKLARALGSYVDYANSLPAAERNRLLNRRVPFWTSVGFAARVLWTVVAGGRGGTGQRGAFNMPCAA
jgi:hypothetical protein